MSFSADVKKELAGQISGTAHCRIAELSALLRFCRGISADETGALQICFRSDREDVVLKYRLLLNRIFRIRSEIRPGEKKGGKQVYEIMTRDQAEVMRILKTAGLYNGNGMPEEAPLSKSPILRKNCCRRAFLRGAFLMAGSISDPNRSYHFEIVCETEDMAEETAALIRSLEIDARIIKRKKYHVVYVKESSQISDLLALMEAPVSMLNFENIRVVRNVRGNVNRKVNCETANIGKTANAAAKQRIDIEYIDRVMGISELPNGLDEMARVRLQYPTATLNELGELLDPPVGKSGVNHRLRKISRIAERLREEQGGFF